jgi:hypothetical protein
MPRRLLCICTLGSLTGSLVIPLIPVHSTILKLAFLACLSGLWLGLMFLTWRRKPIRLALMTLPLLVAFPFLLPGRNIDPDELRQTYVQRMANYEGTRYVWGGENSIGIDCSGLPRRALRDALFAYGIRHLNGRALRSYLEHWWFDASARALGQGYRNYTQPLEYKGTIREMDTEGLMPGDLAVTKNGVHILAYAGNGKWVQADPGIGEVATLDGRNDENIWFSSPITIHRWQILMKDTDQASKR